jgi:hypothetical protein
MGDVLAKGLAWLEAQRHKHLTRTVTYVRNGVAIEWAATVGRTVFEETDAFGAVHRLESRDYLGCSRDLVIGGEIFEPAAGDQVKEQIGASVAVYEVMSPGGEPPFRYSDPDHITVRVHTKRVGTEQ